MNQGFQRQLDEHEKWLESHDMQLKMHTIFIEQFKGAAKVLAWTGIPTAIYFITNYFGVLPIR